MLNPNSPSEHQELIIATAKPIRVFSAYAKICNLASGTVKIYLYIEMFCSHLYHYGVSYCCLWRVTGPIDALGLFTFVACRPSYRYECSRDWSTLRLSARYDALVQ